MPGRISGSLTGFAISIMNSDQRVKQFIDDTLSVDEEKGDILLSLRKMTLGICPAAQEEIKYGGLVFNVDNELLCGIFVRKRHVSLEFSYGIEFSDPTASLEGTGKHRRHLKIMNREDIEMKHAESFLLQAFDR